MSSLDDVITGKTLNIDSPTFNANGLEITPTSNANYNDNGIPNNSIWREFDIYLDSLSDSSTAIILNGSPDFEILILAIDSLDIKILYTPNSISGEFVGVDFEGAQIGDNLKIRVEHTAVFQSSISVNYNNTQIKSDAMNINYLCPRSGVEILNGVNSGSPFFTIKKMGVGSI